MHHLDCNMLDSMGYNNIIIIITCIFCLTYIYSTVPQNVLVVASPNNDSLLKPKSVRTT